MQGRSSVVLMYMILLRSHLYNSDKLPSQLLKFSFLYLENFFLTYLDVSVIPDLLFPESLHPQLLLIV